MTIEEARDRFQEAFNAFVTAPDDSRLEELRAAMYAAGDALSAAKKGAE